MIKVGSINLNNYVPVYENRNLITPSNNSWYRKYRTKQKTRIDRTKIKQQKTKIHLESGCFESESNESTLGM
jgi:hypothetical protein